MQYIWPVIILCGMALIFYHRRRLTKGRPSDHRAIDDLMISRGLKTVAITRNDDYWRYWRRGRMFTLSNCARIYVVLGEDPEGSRREIHAAFDDWFPANGELQVLLEKEIPAGKDRGGLGELIA